MELNDIQKLMQAFNDTGLNRLQYSNGAETLVLEKGHPVGVAPAVSAVPANSPHMQPIVSQAPAEIKPEPAAPVKPVIAENIIKAPMVGVFYPAASPDAAPYVQIGQVVQKGQTLCILEAMKVLNEIQAEWDGTVEAILVEAEDIVEYGQPLFQVRRAG